KMLSTTETQRAQRSHREDLFLVLHRDPGLIGIEELDGIRKLDRLWTKVLLIDHSVMTDHERLHAGHAVLCRKRDQREAADHCALDDKIHLAKRRCRSLTFQHLEEVTVERFSTIRVAPCNRGRHLLSDRTIPLAIGGLPGEPILSSRRADDPLCILIHAGSATLGERVLVLSLDVAAADGDGVELITTDPAVEKFLPAGFRIERPGRSDLHEWHSKGPIVVANLENRAAWILGLQFNCLLNPRLFGKLLRDFSIARRFPGVNDVVTVWSENLGESQLVILLGSIDECIGSFFLAGELLCFSFNRRLRHYYRHRQQAAKSCR